MLFIATVEEPVSCDLPVADSLPLLLALRLLLTLRLYSLLASGTSTLSSRSIFRMVYPGPIEYRSKYAYGMIAWPLTCQGFSSAHPVPQLFLTRKAPSLSSYPTTNIACRLDDISLPNGKVTIPVLRILGLLIDGKRSNPTTTGTFSLLIK